ncbi:MAG TPA: F0F1 ATP synthase subunit B [Planctomycetota bacterium]|nr:F0F1 ATP synthase subunit B [Planctomycetota bacterium]
MEAIKNLFSALGGQIQVIILLSVNFIILVLILNKFLFKRVLTHIDNRKKEIEGTFDKIEQDKKHITQLSEEYQNKISQIEKEAYQKIQSAVKEGLTAKTEIISEAHLQADNVLRKAKEEIGLEKNKAMKEMRQEIISLSISAAEKIIRKEMDEKSNSKIVSEFLEEIDKN